MRIPFFILLLGFFFALSCGNDKAHAPERKELSKQELIIDSIATHYGSAIVYNSQIEFGIGNRLYTITHAENEFEYTCLYTTDSGRYVQRLNESGFSETVNNTSVAFSADDSLTKADGLNRKVMLALLPAILLNRDAEIAQHETEIYGKDYYTLKGTMAQAGSTFPLNFVFWFEKSSFTLDYMALRPFGKRTSGIFATSKNARRVNGFVFQDYEVFEISEEQNLTDLPALFLAEQLQYLYDIEFNRLSVIENPTLVRGV